MTTLTQEVAKIVDAKLKQWKLDANKQASVSGGEDGNWNDIGAVSKSAVESVLTGAITSHTHNYTSKYTTTLGGATSQVVTHNLGTRDVTVTIRQTASPYAQVMADIEFTSDNTLTVYFASAPSADQYTITVIG